MQFPLWDIAPGLFHVSFDVNADPARSHLVSMELRGYMALIADETGCAEQLAKFFPKLAAMRMPVKVSPTRAGQSRLQESTVLEFGAGEIAIFLSNLPIEFDDRVRVSQQDGKRPVEAAVIALQYHEGRKAVAVRFLNGACDWMRQP